MQRSVREAKTIAIREYWKDPDAWDRSSAIDKREAWQNHVAFETAWVLEHLGAAAFAGLLSLRGLLTIVGDVVVDDWLLCRSWVRSYRDTQRAISQVKTTGTTNAHYHRRHAEWLALVATAWMVRHWSYPNCNKLLEWYGGHANLPDQIRNLSQADGDLMPDAVRQELRALTDVKV